MDFCSDKPIFLIDKRLRIIRGGKKEKKKCKITKYVYSCIFNYYYYIVTKKKLIYMQRKFSVVV